MDNKKGKQTVISLIVQSIILLTMLILIFNISLAENDTDSVESKRVQEISSSNVIATFLLIGIIFVIGLYFAVDYAAKKKHMNRAKNAVTKAKQLINEFEQEEQEEIVKQDEIIKKAKLRKNVLQKDLEKRRKKYVKSKKNTIFKAFDDKEEEGLKTSAKYADLRKKEKKKTFLSLNELGSNKRIEKRNKKKVSKKEKELFDKLEELSK